MAFNPFRVMSVERRFTRGQKLARRGDYDQAIAVYDEALTLNDHYGRIYLQKGLAQAAAGQFKRSIASLHKAIELEPRNSVFRFYLALVEFDAGRYAEADQATKDGRELDSGSGFGRGLRGLLLMHAGRVEEACQLLLEPDDRALHHRCQARLLVACTDYLREHADRTAHQVDQRSRHEDGGYASDLWRPALEAEISLLSRIPDLDPEWEAEDDGTEKTEDAEQPGSSGLRKYESASAPNTKHRAPDTEFYARTLAVLPDMQGARMALASLYFDGLYSESPMAVKRRKPRRWWQQHSSRSATASMLALHGVALRAMNRPRDAEEALKNALDRDPELALPQFVLGTMALERGQRDEALGFFSQFAERSPHYGLEVLLRQALQVAENSVQKVVDTLEQPVGEVELERNRNP